MRCKKPFSGPPGPLCPECRNELLSRGGLLKSGEGADLRVRISPLLREALMSVGPLEDFDEALLRALKARHPEQAAALLPAITRMLEIESQRANEDKQQTLRRLADEELGPEVVLKTSGGKSPGITTTIEKQIIRIGDKEYHSLDEVPPHIRRAIEEAKSGKTTKKSPPRMGCTWALLGGWIFTILRGPR